MAIAVYWWGGRREVGILSGNGSEVTPLAMGPGTRDTGALALVEHLAAGGRMPAASGSSPPLSAVRRDAPLPRPRRNLFCVGRNFRAHASELSDSVFKCDGRSDGSWSIVFTKQ